MACPHCSSPAVEHGATGLDLCQRCGGLSRKGKGLLRGVYETWQQPEIAGPTIVATGIVVDGAVVDGQPAIAVTYVLEGGLCLPPLVVAGDQARDLVTLTAAALDAADRRGN